MRHLPFPPTAKRQLAPAGASFVDEHTPGGSPRRKLLFEMKPTGSKADVLRGIDGRKLVVQVSTPEFQHIREEVGDR
jgi:hypothetical protein